MHTTTMMIRITTTDKIMAVLVTVFLVEGSVPVVELPGRNSEETDIIAVPTVASTEKYIT